jgi:iron complex transport system permease protein
MAVVGLILALFNVRSLNLLALGTDLAKGLGQGILKARIVGLSAITLLTAAAVSLTGPIGFVGLTAPHLARALVGADHRRLVPVSGILGAAVLLLADVVGRLLGGQSETQVGVVLSVIGGIAFILIVRRSRQVSL